MNPRILVRAPQWLGDAVVSTVFLKRLKLRYPQSHITVACVPGVAAIFASHPDVNNVIALPYPKATIFQAAQTLRDQFDVAYILPRSFRAAFESWLARIPKRIGYTGDFRRLFLNSALRYDEKRLYAHRYLHLIGESDLPLNNVEPHFPCQRPSPDKIGTFTSDARRPILGIAPISVAPSRTWLPERFAEIANRFLKKNGGSVILFGSPSERTRVDDIAAQIHEGEVINTAGKLSLPELGWTISQCTALLANDSGLMHVAACFKVPTVVLFGASDPTFALPPWGRFLSVQHREIFCVPCLKNTCVRFGAGHLECMKAISVKEADAALGNLEVHP